MDEFMNEDDNDNFDNVSSTTFNEHFLNFVRQKYLNLSQLFFSCFEQNLF